MNFLENTGIQFNSGLIMDAAICAILIFSIYKGARKGLAMTVISFSQWFVCIILGMVFCGRAKSYIMEKTIIDENLNEHIMSHVSGTIEESSAYNSVPDLFSSYIENGGGQVTGQIADSVTSVVMTVIAFLTIVIGIRFAGWLFTLLFSKKYHSGITGFFDGVLGVMFGFVRGVLCIFVFLALLVPVLCYIFPSASAFITESMDKSNIAGFLYNNNVILILLRDLF